MYLLDTHALLWYLRDAMELSPVARREIDNADFVFVSMASLWEIAIKRSIGKIRLEADTAEIAAMCRERSIDLVPIDTAAMDALMTLPKIHGDPFDRIIIATALTRGLTVITRDGIIPNYPVKTLW